MVAAGFCASQAPRQKHRHSRWQLWPQRGAVITMQRLGGALGRRRAIRGNLKSNGQVERTSDVTRE
jgi:hypothetical protein